MKAGDKSVLVLGLSMFVFNVALLPLPRSDNHLLSSDGGYYYAVMRSFWLDRDVDLTNDIALYNARVPPDHPARLGASAAFSVGPALLWSPFFLPAHLAARLAHAAGAPIATDGWSALEEGAVALASVAYVVLGLWLLVRLVAACVPAASAATAVLASFLASSAAYYTLFEPTMSHTLELFTTALFVWAVLCRPLRSLRDAVCLGAIAGLVFLVRWQNAVLLTLLPLAFAVQPSHAPNARRIRTGVEHGIGIVLGFACLASLQLLFWRSTSGSLITVPQGAGFLIPLQPHWLSVLFSTRHVLFTWTPVALLGAIGLARLRPLRLALHASIALLLAIYVCSIVVDWWAGDAFGMRRMIGVLPLLALGTAALLGTAGPRARRALHVALVALVLWNGAFIVQYRLGLVSRSEALGFREMVVDKFRLPAR